jgi:hypothetical protein
MSTLHHEAPGETLSGTTSTSSARPGTSNAFVLAQSLLCASAAATPKSLLQRLGASINVPHIGYRVFFAGIFGFSGYAMGPGGDIRNGTGIATAWSVAYIMLNAKKTFKRPMHPLALAMMGGAGLCAGVYGTEYFVYQD